MTTHIITEPNWADFAAATPTDWTIDATNRIFEYTGPESFITFNPGVGVNFDDDIPVTLIVPRISQQTDDANIRMHNATVYFTNGATSFGGSNNNTFAGQNGTDNTCLLYTSPSPRDRQKTRMPSSA